jgi:hypothetical protein
VGITQALLKFVEKRSENSCFESLNKYVETGGKNMDEESKIHSANQNTNTTHKQHRQCTYNVTLRCVSATIGAMYNH